MHLAQGLPLGSNFNSRPCVRGDGRKPIAASCGRYFNSRPCVRGDVDNALRGIRNLDDFNSRPCVRGDLRSLFRLNCAVNISIHAPA